MRGSELKKLRLADRMSVESLGCRMPGGSDRVKAIESAKYIRNESTRRIYLRALDGAVRFYRMLADEQNAKAKRRARAQKGDQAV